MQIDQFLKQIEERLKNLELNSEPSNLYDPFRFTIQNGGKRIRPLLTMISCEMMGGKVEKSLLPAIAMEIFHNFTLVHDDIMDQAALRRGHPTIYNKWGSNSAILSGDVMFITANKLISSVDSSIIHQVLELFNETAIQVCEGQQFDMDFENSNNISVRQYLSMIEKKTAALLAACLKLGGIIAGAGAEDQNYLYDLGINIGMSFQLKDDILDTYGNTENFGKKIGGDIVANKKTILLVLAIEQSNEKIKKELYSNLLKSDEVKVENTIQIFNQLNVKELALEMSDRYENKVLEILDKIAVDNSKKEKLKVLIKWMKERNK